LSQERPAIFLRTPPRHFSFFSTFALVTNQGLERYYYIAAGFNGRIAAMVRKLLAWAISSPFIVILLALTLVLGGGYAFTHVNVEAYPDPAPAIIEVVAQYPGASAEEVERLVTIPLEIALAGMPHLQYTRS